MKIPSQASRRDQNGMAVIAVIAILSIILIFVAGNLRTLHLLRSDLKLIEKPTDRADARFGLRYKTTVVGQTEWWEEPDERLPELPPPSNPR